MRLALFSLLLLVGCGGAQTTAVKPAWVMQTPFPPKRAVEEVAQAEAKPLPRRAVATAAEWRVEAAPERASIESRFAGVTFTKELRCVAREYGKLRAEKGVGQPDERLERFIASACGVSSPKITTTSWKMAVPEKTSDDQIVTSFAATTPFPTDMNGKPAGAWITRKNDQAILTLVSGTTDDGVTATLADASGQVIVQGTADVDFLGARINRGPYGTAACEHDPKAARPAFRFTCTLAESDPWAWVEVLTSQRSEEALVSSRALLIARRDLTTALELTSSVVSAPNASAANEPERVILDAVNRAREAAKLRPLTLAPKQTVTNARLAPHFFRASFEHDLTFSDDIARGLVAGWDVEGGTIRFGSFFGSLLTGAKSPESWLDFALETPLSRYELLRPEAEQIAIGVAPSASVGGVGVAVTTYNFFERESRAANERAFYRRLARVRAVRKLPPATALPQMPVLEDELALVHAGKRNPRDVPVVVLDRETRRLQRPLAGWFSLTHDLDGMTIPKEFLMPGPLEARVAVTHYRPENSPWGYYAVFLIGSVR